jgi:peptidoglycan/xylan/chitin deacetylase (PgdA/CDA1 family)
LDGVDPKAFEVQLDALTARRRVVPLAGAVAALGRPEAASLAAVTFDDGYRDFAELAVPALSRRGLHATLFVPAGHLGGTNQWDAGHAVEREIIDADGLRALDPAVVEVASHGYSHVRLVALSRDRLRQETLDARLRLEDACGRTIRFFAYPYGQLDDFDSSAEKAVAAAGFEAACSTHFGRGSSSAERFRLRRVGVEPADSCEMFERKLDGAYDWVALKERAGAALRRMRGVDRS